MLDDVDVTLRQLFITEVPGITSAVQVRFQPPDEDWRAYVKTLTVGGDPVNALNVYLVDLRENRRLRTNERTRTSGTWDTSETPAPRRVDCHYLISAWSPADFTPAIEPTLDEHSLLYWVAHALAEHDPLAPDEVFAPAPPPTMLAGETLPIAVLPVEGYPKLAEFWGTMGDKHRLKPCVYLVVTVPLVPKGTPSGPMVTTVLADARQRDFASSSEVVGLIGGVVRDKLTSDPLPNAWVELLTPLNVRLRLARTDADGRFRFEFMHQGAYTLRASSVTAGPVTLAIQIPSPTGDYDMAL
jgi:hypothetical protein